MQFKFSHTYQEGNTVADALANYEHHHAGVGSEMTSSSFSGDNQEFDDEEPWPGSDIN